ncbi:MAG: methyltransferase domain-containing protein [candidate division NC10 bacterium]|nr:methyltransferase domain-containing protein [candidate division NC10 bacterium]
MGKKFVQDMSPEEIREAVKRKYGEVASTSQGPFPFPVGKEFAKSCGYPEGKLDSLPESLTESFAGIGCPVSFADLTPGEVVLDLGSGAGLDAVLAAEKVGPTGKVIGLEMAGDMLKKARRNVQELGLSQVEFREGYAEAMPFEEASVDAVLVNGIFNLSLDKGAIFREVFRVLKPRGRAIICEIVLEKELSSEVKTIEDWFK